MTTAEQQPEESRVAKFWAALPANDGVTAALWRFVEKGQPEFLERYFITTETYPDEYAFYAEVKAEHGGGKYELRVTNPDGSWVSRPTFCIGGKPKRDTGESAATAPAQTDIATLIMQMQDRADTRQEKLLEKLAGNSGTDELDRLEKYSSILNKGQQTPQEKEKSLIEKVIEKKFLAFLDMEGGGKPEGEFDWVKDLAGTLVPGLLQGMMSGKPGAPEVAAAVAEIPPDEQAQLLQKLALLLKGMVQLAGFNVPAGDENTVAKIREQAGNYWPVLEQMIQAPDVVDTAANLVPEILQHREWFECFRLAVIGEPLEQEQEGAAVGVSQRKRTTRAKAAPKPAAKPARPSSRKAVRAA